MHLNEVRGPKDIKGLNQAELEALAQQLRERIVEVVSENGGHLASNLGMVETTLALHRVFDTPEDKIVFDVGHQSYAHKLLTGRQEAMKRLRQFDGAAGFPKISESPHDAYGTGHASTAISAALGLARARDLRQGKEHVIAVVGDGAMTGGMCFEALNDVGNRKTRLIILLNDNQMSIAPNVGGLHNYLTYMRTSKAWIDIKKSLSNFLLKVPLVGKGLFRFMQQFKDSVRNFFIRDRFFDSLGLRYLGPVDGHNEKYLEKVFKRAKRFEEPVLIHLVTQKGRGYEYAEKQPWAAHGVNPFHPEDGRPRKEGGARSFGKAAGEWLVQEGKENPRIVAITAAMAEATGLKPFQTAYPERLFDVGIAEAHAVTLACGLAAGGYRPYVAIYDTFMQRAYDQVVVDACIQNLPVVFLMDRAAMGGADGPTHHGIFGTAFLRHVPNATVLYPRSIEELQAMLTSTREHKGPVFIRYPRGESEGMQDLPCAGFALGKWERLAAGEDLCLIAQGPMVSEALKARDVLLKQGRKAQVVNASSAKPLDLAFLREISRSGVPYYVLEEQALAGGLGSAICEVCAQEGLRLPGHLFSLPDRFVPHGGHDELLRYTKLDGQSVAQAILDRGQQEGIA